MMPNTKILPNYSRIRVVSNSYESKGVKPGDVGYIIEVYPNGDYEVEFFNSTGVNYALFSIRPEDIELADEGS